MATTSHWGDLKASRAESQHQSGAQAMHRRKASWIRLVAKVVFMPSYESEEFICSNVLDTPWSKAMVLRDNIGL